MLLGEHAASKTAEQGSNPCPPAAADRPPSAGVARLQKGTDLVSRVMRVRTPPPALRLPTRSPHFRPVPPAPRRLPGLPVRLILVPVVTLQ